MMSYQLKNSIHTATGEYNFTVFLNIFKHRGQSFSEKTLINDHWFIGL